MTAIDQIREALVRTDETRERWIARENALSPENVTALLTQHAALQAEVAELRRALDACALAIASCGEAHVTDGGNQWFDSRLVDAAEEAIDAARAAQGADHG